MCLCMSKLFKVQQSLKMQSLQSCPILQIIIIMIIMAVMSVKAETALDSNSTAETIPPRPSLKGVTLRSEPFVRRTTNGNYSGIAVDLINFIADETGFDYELYESPDQRYGVPLASGLWNGMIGQVVSGNADFALGALTINEPRSLAVDFTDSFHETQLAALVPVKYATNMTSLKDLAESGNITAVGVINGGATHLFLSTTTQDTARKLWIKIQTNGPSNLVPSMRQGLSRVSKGETPFAFISESTYLEYYAASHPEVKVLVDEERIFPRAYGIALQKNSSYREKFSKAIQKWRNQTQVKD